MNGRMAENVWKLPSSALRQQGEIWYVTKDDTLAKLQAEPVFSNDKAIYVQVPVQMARVPTRIVVHPLSRYLPGMAIQPVMENDNV
jgi:hypothetical protein